MSSEKPLFLCLDCGGSKTAAVLVDKSGNVVGRGTGGPSNFMDVGMNAFLRSVKTAVQAALEEAVGSKTPLPLSSPIMSAAWFVRAPRAREVTNPLPSNDFVPLTHLISFRARRRITYDRALATHPSSLGGAAPAALQFGVPPLLPPTLPPSGPRRL
ncbi:hypothetical protein RSOLAG1IB_10117 [Rhizoctonia solani AG-1 IB]|uniref:N-acetyl-D-glucosamine kinase n=1 Tax=Thanatephorus cucumeris (strain AG1-IB / isolate 7/3/14) TaxID=1108050 RepID=A0A0B7FXI1_THACB|nr:hypothetical protein RSOLAG1IB_10117 [Rhizoctonia solani AG-1 IB]